MLHVQKSGVLQRKIPSYPLILTSNFLILQYLICKLEVWVPILLLYKIDKYCFCFKQSIAGLPHIDREFVDSPQINWLMPLMCKRLITWKSMENCSLGNIDKIRIATLAPSFSWIYQMKVWPHCRKLLLSFNIKVGGSATFLHILLLGWFLKAG